MIHELLSGLTFDKVICKKSLHRIVLNQNNLIVNKGNDIMLFHSGYANITIFQGFAICYRFKFSWTFHKQTRPLIATC